MQRLLREQSRTSRTNPCEPEAKSLSSQPPPKIPEPPQATTTALPTNYTISDDRSNSSRYAYNLLLALQHQPRGTPSALFEPQAITSAGTGTKLGEYRPDQSPSLVRQYTEEAFRAAIDLFPPPPTSLETSDLLPSLDLLGSSLPFEAPEQILNPQMPNPYFTPSSLPLQSSLPSVSVPKVPLSLGYY
jgi:hypothetical protein